MKQSAFRNGPTSNSVKPKAVPETNDAVTRVSKIAQQLLIDGMDGVAIYDVMFIFPNKKILKSNAKFLKKSSPYFKLMLDSGFKEAITNSVTKCKEIIIKDHNYDVYRAVLRYLITTTIEFSRVITPPLIYSLAHQLEIEELKKLAIDDYRSNYLGLDNLLPELVSDLVDTYSELKTVVKELTVFYWSLVVSHQSYTTLVESIQDGNISRGGLAFLFECIALATTSRASTEREAIENLRIHIESSDDDLGFGLFD